MKPEAGQASTVLMGVMHDALRRDFARARAVLAADEAPSAVRARALADHITFMLTFLDLHHHNEDEKLWPLVRAQDPALGPLLEAMSQDHAGIAAEVGHLAGATRRFGDEPTAAARAALVRAIDRLTAVLCPHLDREEAELMPRVATCLSAAQWKAFEKAATPPFPVAVMAEYLNWFLEDLDPARRRQVLKGLPAPIGIVSTRWFGPGYRRRAAFRWDGAGAQPAPPP